MQWNGQTSKGTDRVNHTWLLSICPHPPLKCKFPASRGGTSEGNRLLAARPTGHVTTRNIRDRAGAVGRCLVHSDTSALALGDIVDIEGCENSVSLHWCQVGGSQAQQKVERLLHGGAQVQRSLLEGMER
jgi:hypothetical protein